jgi:hypothetical protein
MDTDRLTYLRSTVLICGLLLLAAWCAAAIATNRAGPVRCDVGAEEDIGCARGFETRERDGRSFRWTDGEAAVRLHAAGYGAPLLAEITLAAPRPPDVAAPRVTLNLGGAQATFAPAPQPRTYRLLAPPGFPAGDVATLRIAGETWRPPGDRRALGVQVYDAALRPLGAVLFPAPLHTLALLGIGLAAALANGGRWSALSALAAILLAAALWALLPARAAPFLPGLALLLGPVALANRFGRRAAELAGRAARLERGHSAGVWPVTLAVLLGATIDWAFAAGLARGPWLSAGVIAQAAITFGALWLASSAGLTLGRVLGVALAVRLLALGGRLLIGAGAGDPDVELFYSYGRATLELGVPVVEYPSGALPFWALLALPGSRELFALLLPLLNTACDLLIVFGLWKIVDCRLQIADFPVQPPISNLQSPIPLFYALSPLLLPFWHGKYDPLPGALLALGLAAFATGRPLASGALLGLGGAVKWVPWLAAPLLALHYLRRATSGSQRPVTSSGRSASALGLSAPVVGLRSPALWRFAGGLVAAIALASLPFALRDPGAFLAPYTLQGGRPLIGESLWFLPALLAEPGLLAGLTHPWSNVESSAIAPGLTVAAQGLALAALALPLLLLPPERRRTLALAALAPGAFLLLNRIFSPQYVLLITVSALAAGAATLRRREALVLVGLLAAMQAANLLVWPYTSRYWLAASAVLFGVGLPLLAWLAARAALPRPAPLQLELERPAEEGADPHDDRQHAETLERGGDRHRPNDVGGYQELQPEEQRPP